MVKDKPGFHVQDYADKIVILGAMLGAVIVFMSIFNKMRKKGGELPVPVAVSTQPRHTYAMAGNPPAGVDDGMDSIQNIQAAEYSEEILHAQKIRETVGSYIQTKPDDAAKLLKVWLTDGGD